VQKNRSVLRSIPFSQRSCPSRLERCHYRFFLQWQRVQIKLCQLDLYLCCLYQAKCSLVLSSGDYNTATSTTASRAVWIHSWSLNGGCYSCSAVSVRVVQKIFKASACGLRRNKGCVLIRWTGKHYGRLF